MSAELKAICEALVAVFPPEPMTEPEPPYITMNDETRKRIARAEGQSARFTALVGVPVYINESSPSDQFGIKKDADAQVEWFPLPEPPPNPGLVSGGGERPPHRPDSGEYDIGPLPKMSLRKAIGVLWRAR